MRRVNLLSLDGGGIRGLIPLHLLNALSEIMNIRTFDALAGTSTGGITAAGLSLFQEFSGHSSRFSYSIPDLINLYEGHAKEIFSRKGFGIFQSRYKEAGLEAVLKLYFGDSTLTQCKIPLVIPTYNIANFSPVFFKSRYVDDPKSKFTERASSWKMWEILRSTSAAPTYFPRFEKDGMKLIDGGIHVNSPALSLLMEIVGNPDYYGIPLPSPGPKNGNNINSSPRENFQINLLSVGTGRTSNKNRAPIFGGAASYILKALDIAMFGNIQLVDHNLIQLKNSNGFQVLNFEFNYFRLSPEIEKEEFGKLDSVSPAAFDYFRKLAADYFAFKMSISERKAFGTFLQKVTGAENMFLI